MYLPPDFFFADPPVAIGNGREPNGFFRAKGKVPEILQTEIEKPEDLALQLALEIDQRIPAKDQLKLVEGEVGDKVVGREDHLCRQRRIKLREVVVGGVIGGKVPDPTRLDIVLGIFL